VPVFWCLHFWEREWENGKNGKWKMEMEMERGMEGEGKEGNVYYTAARWGDE